MGLKKREKKDDKMCESAGIPVWRIWGNQACLLGLLLAKCEVTLENELRNLTDSLEHICPYYMLSVVILSPIIYLVCTRSLRVSYTSSLDKRTETLRNPASSM